MPHSRREFLKTAAAAPLVIPARAFGANDRLAYAAIGIGSRGGWLNQTFQKLGAECVALCDVYEPNLEAARGNSPAGAKPYVNHHDALSQPGIDFVVVATPDHHHCPILLDALAAGKDVYLEKPLSTSLDESRKMVDAVRASKQIVQVGMQRRSMPFIMNARKLVAGGALGKVSMVKAMWNWNIAVPLDDSPLAGKLDWDRFLGGAPKRPLEPKRFRWWRAFWDYCGGNMTDQGTHLMDVVQWLTGSPPPRSALCKGMISAHRGGEVSMLIDRRGFRVYKDYGRSPAPWAKSGQLEVIAEEPDRDTATVHQQNFLDSVRSRQEPNCTVEIAAAAVTGPHIANQQLRR
jgi:predicted dehydrogenase